MYLFTKVMKGIIEKKKRLLFFITNETKRTYPIKVVKYKCKLGKLL